MAALLATTGCAGSLMHSRTTPSHRAERSDHVEAPAQVPGRTAIFTPPPHPEAPAPSKSAPVPAATAAAPPEPAPEPIVVSGKIARKPAPPAPPVYPNNAATIAFAIRPAENCPTCQNVKITASPTGQVLIEVSNWDNIHRDWKYQRSRAKVTRNTANAFAASLNAVRPVGEQALGVGGLRCGAASRDDGLTIDWIEYGRRDRLNVRFDCSGAGDSRLAQRLRHAPDVLGLRKLIAP